MRTSRVPATLAALFVAVAMSLLTAAAPAQAQEARRVGEVSAVTVTAGPSRTPEAATGPSTPIGALVVLSGLGLLTGLAVRYVAHKREG
ncbi:MULTISPECIES: hypothetical protein [Prauserella salsuginis group]|uniref:LPXTG-motif cell wall-anchored protein n=2 Tax=Prauserella salsuginis group TaxID=2893672 RepID=A0A839XGP7_9PSEU|nr:MULTISPECIES: hypothetical protein [Prauserella salsuginis group]MBB3663142.1 hypothetical protein [Prauserella sediminis]MCR3721029.1 hypothetical protein [Prauserella flava]MCR3734890.1 hypothetical protein [Prauserella salsuginis]